MSIIEKALEKSGKSSSFSEPLKVSGSIAMEQAERANKVKKVQESSARPVERETEEIDFTFDFEMLEKKGMLVPDSAHSQMAEEYRLIKRPLLENAFFEGDNGIDNANLLLVTSSLPGEGKTFTAINLALSIATERDKTVLLIDADVAKPSVSKVLGIQSDIGLIDLLVDPSIGFSDAMLKTDIPNLSIIPAGKKHRHSTEVLASNDMKQFTRELSERYSDRIIIFDSPPILAATQGAVLAKLVGQVVMVVESETTPQYVVKDALAKVLESCDVVGCVLNKMKKGIGLQYYGYSYYGYYGR